MATPAQPDNVSRIVMLTHGLMETSGRYWCYVAVKPSRFEEFQAAVAGKYNIQNFDKDGYGEVVVSGEGAEPPQEVTDQVGKLFGVDPKTFFTDKNPQATLAKKLAES